MNVLWLGEELAKLAMQQYEHLVDGDDYSVAAANEMRDMLFSCPVRALTRLALIQFNANTLTLRVI